MRRWVTIVTSILAIGLLFVGARLLFKATGSEGWSAAVPALSGLGCFIGGGILIGRPAIGLVTYPITALLGGIFHPGEQFTETPKSQLLTLRARIAEGRFRSVEHQITGLLKAYPRDPGLYHVWALLDAAKGRQINAVTAEALRELPASAFAEYEALLRAIPPQPSSSKSLRQTPRESESPL